ncbi:MAG: DUF4199 domain-containing protein [Bacteroidales bacterium]|jgi:hypothetical protein|nr:DUF4199 domain-containing protein [Bacteroidales bacterium]
MNEKSAFWKSGATSGVILGIVLIIYSVLLYMLDLNMNKSLGYVTYLFLIVGLWWFTKSYRDNTLGGTISYGQALGYAMVIVVVAALISSVYSYVFLKYIDPSMIDKIAAMSEEEMLKQGMSDEQIELAQSMSKKFMSPGLMNIMGFLGTSVFGFLIALVTSAVVKKEGDPYKTAMKDVE